MLCTKLLRYAKDAVERSMEMDMRNGCALSNEPRGSEQTQAEANEIIKYIRVPVHASPTLDYNDD